MESLRQNMRYSVPVLALGALALLALAGCAETSAPTYPYGQPTYAQGQPVYAPNAYGQPTYAVDQYGRPVYTQPAYTQAAYGSDDYIYYPDAEVYYSPARGQYLYQSGYQWFASREPPRHWQNGVSVHVNLRDGPERHHSEIRREYPPGWRPRGRDRDHDRDDDRDYDRR